MTKKLQVPTEKCENEAVGIFSDLARTGQKITGNNDEKLRESLSRSKSKVYQLAVCNEWEYFCTMTIDGAKHDRHDLKAFRKKLSKWINNYNGKHKTSVKYLLIPELHKKDPNAWHIHGLLMGLPEKHLTAFTLADKLPHTMRKLLKDGRKLYNWCDYAAAFGWVSMERVQNPEAVAHYISKYVTKNLGAKIELNDHVYYCSKGLKRAVPVLKAHLQKDLDPDFINEHIAIKTVHSMREVMEYFTPPNS